MFTLIKGKGEPPKNPDPKQNICLVATHNDGTKEWWYGSNIVTDDGDEYYAQQSANVATSGSTVPSPNFYACCCVLQIPSSQEAAGTNSANFKDDTIDEFGTPILTGTSSTTWSVVDVESGYPKANDLTGENSGRGAKVVTYKFIWDTTEINTGSGNAITGGAIVAQANVTRTNTQTPTIASGAKLLTRWNFENPASFHKTGTDTLTLYVNHSMSGTG